MRNKKKKNIDCSFLFCLVETKFYRVEWSHDWVCDPIMARTSSRAYFPSWLPRTPIPFRILFPLLFRAAGRADGHLDVLRKTGEAKESTDTRSE